MELQPFRAGVYGVWGVFERRDLVFCLTFCFLYDSQRSLTSYTSLRSSNSQWVCRLCFLIEH
jgi:hypothetical protein